jgi:hypothetical protein
MKQFKIHIESKNKDWGEFPVLSLHWSHEKLICIFVDWYNNEQDSLVMYDFNNTGIFINNGENLTGALITT